MKWKDEASCHESPLKYSDGQLKEPIVDNVHLVDLEGKGL